MADFQPKILRDEVLNIKDSIDFDVLQGAADVTPFSQQFNSSTTTSANVSLTVPNENIIMNRRMFVRGKMEFTVTITGVDPAANAFDYGGNCAFQAFPFNNLINNLDMSMNNARTSISNADILSCILRQIPPEELQRYSPGSPTMLDSYKDYQQSFGRANCPFNGFAKAGYNDERISRGAHPLTVVSAIRTPTGGGGDDTLLISANLGDSFVVKCTASFYEPLFLSPLMYSKGKDGFSGGISGLNQIGLNMSVDPTMRRAWSAGPADVGRVGTYDLTLTGLKELFLEGTYYTAPPQVTLPSRSVTPYYDYISHVTSGDNLSDLTSGNSEEYTSASLQIESVPDQIFIFARASRSTKSARVSDTFLAIDGVKINFNNKSSILASATTEDLYRISKRNGLQMDFNAWRGTASASRGLVGGALDEVRNEVIYTAGGILVLNPAVDLSIGSNPFLSNSSVGQFNLQVRLSVTNNSPISVRPEISIVLKKAGILTTIGGQASYQNALLNRSIISDAIDREKDVSFYPKDNNRVVGGSAPQPEKFGSGPVSGGMKNKLDSLSSATRF